MNRRDVLKMFGIGAVVAPVAANGLVSLDAASRLVEVPVVEPITMALRAGFFPSNPYASSMVRVQDPMPVWVKDVRLDARVRSLSIDSEFQLIDVTSHNSPGGFREFKPTESVRLLAIVVELP